jgi:hypothetical protein
MQRQPPGANVRSIEPRDIDRAFNAAQPLGTVDGIWAGAQRSTEKSPRG